jgi:thiol:disulfide interchange protein
MMKTLTKNKLHYIFLLWFLLLTPALNAAVQKVDTTGTSGLVFEPVVEAPVLEHKAVTESVKSLDVAANQAASQQKAKEPLSLWTIFLAGFLGGLAAILLPCIFPMLPLTVGFFTKRHTERRRGIIDAVIYGLSIILIYVGLGMLITIVFGADALNALATNGIFNFVFFVLLVVFAASFFGAFEIVLPNKWLNKAEENSDRKGFAGIFFMAATLALVSFSCTGPIIGTLLVEAATSGARLGPAMGMFGFSLALALPFVLFALFPSWLKGLPKSGGWLNSVKVCLGFLELALSLKFLSNVDLTYRWHILDREVFLVLWIVIAALAGLYLLGKLTFSHDSELKYISVPRLFMAIIVLSFSVYMIPGLWGAPLKSIAAFLPPQSGQDFDLYTPLLSESSRICLTNRLTCTRFSITKRA